MLYLFASNLFFFMKKHALLLAAFVLSTASYGQLKVLKFGAKAGLNYPQTSLSASDVLAIYNDQTYDISNLQTDISNGFNAGLIARVALPLIPAYVRMRQVNGFLERIKSKKWWPNGSPCLKTSNGT